jgi:hypothetical protein
MWCDLLDKWIVQLLCQRCPPSISLLICHPQVIARDSPDALKFQVSREEIELIEYI